MVNDLFDSNLTSGLSAIAAILSAWFAYRSNRVSQKAMNLALSESNAKKSNITVYLADSFRIYDNKRKIGKYIFSITYFNKSDLEDSITEVHLEIFYVNSANKVSHLMIPHESKSIEWLSGKALPANLPLNLRPRSSITGWFIFGSLTIVEKAQRISKYRVVAKNGQGHIVDVESYIIKEVEYEEFTNIP